MHSDWAIDSTTMAKVKEGQMYHEAEFTVFDMDKCLQHKIYLYSEAKKYNVSTLVNVKQESYDTLAKMWTCMNSRYIPELIKINEISKES